MTSRLIRTNLPCTSNFRDVVCNLVNILLPTKGKDKIIIIIIIITIAAHDKVKWLLDW